MTGQMGYVYVLTNEGMPGLVKIGYTFGCSNCIPVGFLFLLP